MLPNVKTLVNCSATGEKNLPHLVLILGRRNELHLAEATVDDDDLRTSCVTKTSSGSSVVTTVRRVQRQTMRFEETSAASSTPSVYRREACVNHVYAEEC